jgi:multidrug efflux pump subunit AcrA (membrane-fusion protein)
VQGGQRIEIRSGLRPGEQVVVDPPANLRDGARVTLRSSVQPS